MNRRHSTIVLVIAVLVVIFALIMFTGVNQAPSIDGGQTADDPAQQRELPAGPASEPAVLTP